jgi:hypothetical protein
MPKISIARPQTGSSFERARLQPCHHHAQGVGALAPEGIARVIHPLPICHPDQSEAKWRDPRLLILASIKPGRSKRTKGAHSQKTTPAEVDLHFRWRATSLSACRPVPGWVKSAVDLWTDAAKLQDGTLFRAIGKAGKVQGRGFTAKVIWSIVREAALSCSIGVIAPHNLRRTCARLCHQAGGELEQIQFLLGHVSVQTTERYLGCKQRLQNAVNDQIGLEPSSPTSTYSS